MIRIKICGITSRDDALAAIEAGADMLGIVFAASPRRVEPSSAKLLVEALPPGVPLVGVFKDQSVEDVLHATSSLPLRFVQLHGDESSATCDALPFEIIRRIAVEEGDATDDLRARIARHRASAFLLDPGAGSGRAFRWEIARGLDAPVFLAGGLTPENVAEAIRIARPYGVDVSSGVERTPGRKDFNKMAAFVRAVRECDANRNS
jgi:phosphoribosylanthranilate isomerase